MGQGEGDGVSKPTHRITVTIDAQYQHAAVTVPSASVCVSGSGNIDHFLDVFRAALVAAGYAAGTAEKLQIVEGDE